MAESFTCEIADAERMTALGEALGRLFRGGEVVALSGPLGAGKTQLTKGIALGLGVPADEPVTSPTFVLIRGYAGRLALVHCDAYRLASFEELLDLGWEDLTAEPDAVTVIEWADRFPQLETAEAWRIELNYADLPVRRVDIRPPAEADSQEIRESLAAFLAPCSVMAERKNASNADANKKHG